MQNCNKSQKQKQNVSPSLHPPSYGMSSRGQLKPGLLDLLVSQGQTEGRALGQIIALHSELFNPFFFFQLHKLKPFHVQHVQSVYIDRACQSNVCWIFYFCLSSQQLTNLISNIYFGTWFSSFTSIIFSSVADLDAVCGWCLLSPFWLPWKSNTVSQW